MKQKIYLVLAGLFLLSAQLKAQAPQALNYQGVARDAIGSLIPNQSIGLEFTIKQGSSGGTIVYQETQTQTTNEFGLFTAVVGNGNVVSGNFSNIVWGGNAEYLEVGMDPSGGTNYIEMGTQELLSVPYALYAASSGSGGGGSVTSVSTNSPLSVTTPTTTPALSLIGTSGTILYGTGTASDFNALGSAGQVLQSNGTGAPTWVSANSALTTSDIVAGDGSSVVVTNGNKQVVGASNVTLDVQGNAGGIFYGTGAGTSAAFNPAGLTGNILISAGAGVPQWLGNGASGQVLTANSSGIPTWVTPSGGGNANVWGLSGNAGTTYNSNPTTSAGNFIGTTDDEGLQFRINGNIAGLIEDFSSSEGDAAFGYEALYNNYENGGSQSEAFGYQALYNNGGTQNDAFGYQALYGNTYGTQNVGIGYQSLYNNDNDQQGLANYNTAVGALSLYNNIDNANNVAIGYQALYSDDLDDNNSANYNTAVGALALSNDVDGSSNTAIGFNANFSSSDQGNAINNSTAIGANALVNTSNTVQLGRFANVQFDQALMPAGNAGTAGQVLQSNGANTAPTWVAPSGGGNAWGLSGNAGTTYGTNFIGTTDDQGILFEINGYEAGRIEDGNSGNGSNWNVALGFQSLVTNSGTNNVAMGNYALATNTGNYNVGIGGNAMNDNTGSDNVGVGFLALSANQGNNNTATGYKALQNNESGFSNVAIGAAALANNYVASQNVAVGYSALSNNDNDGFNIAQDNSALGFQALQNNIDGYNNTAMGSQALQDNIEVYDNTAFGAYALMNADMDNNGTAYANTAVGSNALDRDIDGNDNTSLGYQADLNNSDQGNASSNNIVIGSHATINNSNGAINNATVIGAAAVADSSNSVVLGNNSVIQTDFNGALGVWNGSNYNEGAVGQVLQSNGPDVAPTWVAPTGVSGVAWALTGNSGTTYGTNYIGTSDNINLMFRIDKYEAGRIENATTANTALGYGSLFNLGSGAQNTGVGVYALYPDVDGSDNTALGYEAGFNASDDGNPSSNITLLGANTFINNIPGAINNATGIGASTEVDSSNSIVLGNHVVTQTDFNGDFGIWNGSYYNAGATGQVLQSNGPNVAPTWVTAGGTSNAWSLTGNAGTTYGTNYIGTSDETNIMFGLGGAEAGRLEDNATGNTSVGYQTLMSETSGELNTAMGNSALMAVTSGSNNSSFGTNSMFNIQASSYNSAFGAWAMSGLSSGTENTTVGYNSQSVNTTGSNNASLGYQAMFGLSGSQNTAIGSSSMSKYQNSGSQNTAVGDSALFDTQGGNTLTALGYNATVGASNLTDATAIGSNAVVDSSNSIVLGDNNVTQTDFNGALGVWTGSNYNEGAPGQVLQSNGTDVAPTWASSNAWSLNGNSGTTYGTNYIGTADDEGIMFEVDGYTAGRIEDGNPGAGSNWNNSIGFLALQTDSGTNNEAFGGEALNYNTGSNNVAVGNAALGTNSGDDNVAVGSGALNDNQGTGNTAIGYSSLQGNLTGNQITVLGYGANVGVDGLTNATAIGAGSVVDSSNSVVLGNNSVTQTDFNGALGVWTGSNYNEGAAGQVLQSNGPDVAPIWVTPAGSSGGSAAGNNTDIQYNNSGAFGASDNFQYTGYSLNLEDNSGNLFVGQNAGDNTGSSGGNVGLGQNAMGTVAGGAGGNVGIGLNACNGFFNVLSGSYNVCLGQNAGSEITTGASNIGLGLNALGGGFGSITGQYNIGIGQNSLSAGDTMSGNNNIGIGLNTIAVSANTTGSNNINIGANGLGALTSGSNNIAIGDNVFGATLQTGGNLIGIGSNVSVSTDGLNNSIGLGDGSTITTSNQFVMNSSITNWNIGGVDYNIPTSQGGSNTALVNDGSGNLSWGTPSASVSINSTQIGYGSGSNTLTSDPYFTRNGTEIQVSDGVDDIFIGGNGSAGNDYPSNQGGGSANIGLGSGALSNIANGSNNIALGDNALATNQDGSNLIAIGAGADVNANNTYTNSIALGSTTITSSNQFVMNSLITNWNIGGVSYVIPTSQGASNTVLTNDGSGNLSWAAPVSSTGVAEFVQSIQIPNISVAPGTAFTIGTQVINTAPSSIITLSGDGGTVFELAPGTYSIDYEMSLNSAGSIALYTGPDASSLAVDNNTVAGSSTATTWIHGKAFETVASGNLFIAVSPVVGTAAVATAGTDAGQYMVRLTITKLQ